MAKKNKLTKKISQMVHSNIQKADLMDYSLVRGCVIFKPMDMKSGNIFKRISAIILKEKAAFMCANVKFKSFFTKEADHVKKFALITMGGSKQLVKN